MDFKLLDGIDANKTDPCTLQFLAAPICLLYKNLANKIVPIAIQVGGPARLSSWAAPSSAARAQGAFPGWIQQTSRRERQQSCLEPPA